MFSQIKKIQEIEFCADGQTTLSPIDYKYVSLNYLDTEIMIKS